MFKETLPQQKIIDHFPQKNDVRTLLVGKISIFCCGLIYDPKTKCVYNIVKDITKDKQSKGLFSFRIERLPITFP